MDESWEEFDNEYHMTVEGCDRDGHPIVAFRVGEWGKDFIKQNKIVYFNKCYFKAFFYFSINRYQKSNHCWTVKKIYEIL